MMSDQLQSPSAQTLAERSAGLSPEQIAGEQAQELPDREAMSLLDVGGMSGLFPTPAVLEPALPSDPATPMPASVGIPADVDLTQVLDDATPLGSPGALADVQEATDVTGASVDAGGAAGLMQPPADESSTLA